MLQKTWSSQSNSPSSPGDWHLFLLDDIVTVVYIILHNTDLKQETETFIETGLTVFTKFKSQFHQIFWSLYVSQKATNWGKQIYKIVRILSLKSKEFITFRKEKGLNHLQLQIFQMSLWFSLCETFG